MPGHCRDGDHRARYGLNGNMWMTDRNWGWLPGIEAEQWRQVGDHDARTHIRDVARGLSVQEEVLRSSVTFMLPWGHPHGHIKQKLELEAWWKAKRSGLGLAVQKSELKPWESTAGGRQEEHERGASHKARQVWIPGDQSQKHILKQWVKNSQNSQIKHLYPKASEPD